jgi:hypothetical protein
MLQTVRDACQFDPKAIDYALSEQIEDVADLLGLMFVTSFSALLPVL